MIERTEGFLQVRDGEDLWYETAGTGPAVVLAHGLGGNATIWFQQLPYFARTHYVITWDQRGFGRSSDRNGQHGPFAAVADQIAILDHLGIDEVDLIGQSMGGWAALGTALEVPERVRNVVLASSTGGVPVDISHAGKYANTSQVQGTGTLPLGVHPALGEQLSTESPALAYLYQAMGTFGDRPSSAEFIDLLAASEFDGDLLMRLQLPVLFLCAEFDDLIPADLIRAAATRLPQASVQEILGAGHSAYFEKPDVWNRIVSAFIS